MNAPLLTLLLVGTASAAPLAWTGPSVGAQGHWLPSGDGVVTFQVDVPLPNVRVTWVQRLALSSSRGALTLKEPRVSWACPSGLPAARVPGGSRVILYVPGQPDQTWTGQAAWKGTVLHLSPDVRLPVRGADALTILDARKARLTVTLPAASTAIPTLKGCTPKLHARTALEEIK